VGWYWIRVATRGCGVKTGVESLGRRTLAKVIFARRTPRDRLSSHARRAPCAGPVPRRTGRSRRRARLLWPQSAGVGGVCPGIPAYSGCPRGGVGHRPLRCAPVDRLGVSATARYRCRLGAGGEADPGLADGGARPSMGRDRCEGHRRPLVVARRGYRDADLVSSEPLAGPGRDRQVRGAGRLRRDPGTRRLGLLQRLHRLQPRLLRRAHRTRTRRGRRNPPRSALAHPSAGYAIRIEHRSARHPRTGRIGDTTTYCGPTPLRLAAGDPGRARRTPGQTELETIQDPQPPGTPPRPGGPRAALRPRPVRALHQQTRRTRPGVAPVLRTLVCGVSGGLLSGWRLLRVSTRS
jgi:hypothetical protein